MSSEPTESQLPDKMVRVNQIKDIFVDQIKYIFLYQDTIQGETFNRADIGTPCLN